MDLEDIAGISASGGSSRRNSQIKILSIAEDRISFVLTNSHLSFANALRRVMIAEVPTLTIDLVQIDINTSAIPDLVLSHRLGLIPLHCDAIDKFNFTRDCDCEGTCERCCVNFELDMTSEEKDRPTDVVSEDIVINDQENSVTVAELHREHKKRNQQILIAQLKSITRDRESGETSRPQRIKLSGVIKKGIGKEHAKWSPVCGLSFFPEPKVEIDETSVRKLTEEQLNEFAQSCPKKIFEVEGDTVRLVHTQECITCEECVKTANGIIKNGKLPFNNFVSISESESTFYYDVETTGSMPALDVLLYALSIIRKKCIRIAVEAERPQDEEYN